ncbi:MAG: IlvD/Edd family dehydratase [Myxococcota bacterium]
MSDSSRKKPSDLRSHTWYGRGPFSFLERSRTLQNGYLLEEFNGKPVIGVINTWSDMSTCHRHLRDRAQEVKRGVVQAGGFPVELPAMGVGEVMMQPTSMLYRNFLAMEVEELLRCHPIDAVVLLGGCDKTTPALLMGAFSMDLPLIYVPAGFMLAGYFRGKPVGTSDLWRFGQDLRAGKVPISDVLELEQVQARSVGTCNSMGTASTMTAAAEALGLSLPGASSLPAVDARAGRLAVDAGRRIVELAWNDIRPSTLLTRESFLNAVAVCLALGGSTNAVIHLLAMAGRAGVELTLGDFDQLAREVPILVDVQPAGSLLMESYDHAGGSRALMCRLGNKLHGDAATVTGASLSANVSGAEVWDDKAVRPFEDPVAKEALAVLRGNLCPEGAIIKPSAATEALMVHRGRAVVFDGYEDLVANIESPDRGITPQSVLILRNCGPRGGPGMPECGMIPIPGRLIREGVRDMVRISDARMSGTSFGTCVLHVAPEAYVGGPLALVQGGDWIELDVTKRTLTLDVDDAELGRRRAAWSPPAPRYARGYGSLFAKHVGQASEGCDFDFLASSEVSEPLPFFGH